MIDPQALLMLEPGGAASPDPIIDDYTKLVAKAWRSRTSAAQGYRGVHSCVCGAMSDNRDHYIGDWLTNSLCVHYVAYHREEVQTSLEWEKVRWLRHKYGNITGIWPTREELATPPRRVGHVGRKADVEA